MLTCLAHSSLQGTLTSGELLCGAGKGKRRH